MRIRITCSTVSRGKRHDSKRAFGENHPAPEGLVTGKPYHCRRCSGLVEAIPFSAGLPHATVTYPDGGKYTINGYDGLQYNEEQFAKKNDLF